MRCAWLVKRPNADRTTIDNVITLKLKHNINNNSKAYVFPQVPLIPASNNMAYDTRTISKAEHCDMFGKIKFVY